MNERRAGLVRVLLFAAVVLLGLLELMACVSTPFLSEDWTHLEEMRSVPSFLAALSPEREPLRPFQHAFFWVLGHCGADPAGAFLPPAAHLFAFLLHAGAIVCVALLARAAGGSGLAPWLAVALFAAFPNVKSVAWSAAIGNPGCVACALFALWAWARYLDGRATRHAVLGMCAWALALAWHESALLLPAVLVAWIVFVHADDLRAGVRELLARLRDPWVLAFFLAGLAYVVYLFLRPSRYHRAKSLDALPANVVKAATSLCPEDLRVLVVEGFRAHAGPPFVIACVVFALLVCGAVFLFVRSRLARFVLTVAAVELGLPALGTGFVQRYAYFAAAIVALGLALWAARRGGPWRFAAVAVLGMAWARDSVVDASDYSELARAVPQWYADLRAHREQVGGTVPIAILDPPDMTGREEDVPVFNWGLDYALAAERVPGPWLFWRRREYHTSTSVELVEPERVRAALETGSPVLHALVPLR